jgi:hypothetical protein
MGGRPQACPSHQVHDVGATGDVCLAKGNAIDTTIRVGTKFRERLDALFHALGIGGDIVLRQGECQRHQQEADENVYLCCHGSFHRQVQPPAISAAINAKWTRGLRTIFRYLPGVYQIGEV